MCISILHPFLGDSGDNKLHVPSEKWWLYVCGGGGEIVQEIHHYPARIRKG